MSVEDDNENPLDAIRERADELGLDGDERDDFIERRMQRAGFKRGPGEWISVDDDDDEENDDDDEPMTRGDWRRMQRDKRRESVRKPSGSGAQKVQKRESDDGEKGGEKKGKKRRDPWW